MEYTLNSTLVSGSPIITVDARRLIPNLFTYSAYFIPGTRIQSIDSSFNFLTATSNAIDNFSGNITYSDLVPYKRELQCNALHDVQRIINDEGSYITILLRSESNITRDAYNSIEERANTIKFNIKAYPIIFNASKDLKEKIGFREDTEVVIYTAHQDWIDAGYTYEQIDPIRDTVRIFGNTSTFFIKDKTFWNVMGNSATHILLGLACTG
jgi:hypothetical protein